MGQTVGGKKDLPPKSIAQLRTGSQRGTFHLYHAAAFLPAAANLVGRLAIEAVSAPGSDLAAGKSMLRECSFDGTDCIGRNFHVPGRFLRE